MLPWYSSGDHVTCLRHRIRTSRLDDLCWRTGGERLTSTVPNYLSGAPAINGIMMYFGAGTTDRFVKVLEKSVRQGAWLRVLREEGWRKRRERRSVHHACRSGCSERWLCPFGVAFRRRVAGFLRSCAGQQIFRGPSMLYGVSLPGKCREEVRRCSPRRRSNAGSGLDRVQSRSVAESRIILPRADVLVRIPIIDLRRALM